MAYYTKGKVVDTTELPQYKDQKTGELGKRQFIVQIMTTNKLSNGNSKNELIDIKIDESKVNDYKSKIGKDETIEFSIYSKAPISLTEI